MAAKEMISAVRTVQASPLLPFLYPPLRCHWQPFVRRCRECSKRTAHNRASRPPRPNAHVPFVSEINDEPDPPVDSSVDPGSRTSTITAEEQAAFDRIFRELSRQGKESVSAKEAGKSSGKPKDVDDKYGGAVQDLQSFLGSISGETAPSGSSKQDELSFWDGEGVPSSKVPVRAKEGQETALMGYPERSRAAVAAAATIRKIRDTSLRTRIARSVDDGAQEDARQTAINPEVQRVEGLLRAATTDFEVWKVLEQEVFSMVKPLEVAATSEAKDAPDVLTLKKRKTKRKKGKKTNVKLKSEDQEMAEASDARSSGDRTEENISNRATKGNSHVGTSEDATGASSGGENESTPSTDESGHHRIHEDGSGASRIGGSGQASIVKESGDTGSTVDQPPSDGMATLDRVGPIYAHLLLLAMRIFRHDLNQPNECVSLFMRIKRLGPMSYILGASTELYNEMIAVRWKYYVDFPAIDDLLTEMDRGGIPVDVRTMRLLKGMAREQRMARNGDFGTITQVLWGFDHVETSLTKLHRWTEIVDERVIEQTTRAAELEMETTKREERKVEAVAEVASVKVTEAFMDHDEPGQPLVR